MLRRFVAIVSTISVGLALFEISLEKNHGWGTGLGSFWGKKYFQSGFIARMCEKLYFTRYHLVLFCLLLPLLLYVLHRRFKIPTLVLIAAWFAIGVVEDALWFIMNWHLPGSLMMLLAGKIWWHTVYWHIGSAHFPRFYVLSSLWAAGFLLAQHYLFERPRQGQ